MDFIMNLKKWSIIFLTLKILKNYSLEREFFDKIIKYDSFLTNITLQKNFYCWNK